MILHAIVSDFDSALQAVDAGATVVQLRLKDATTDERVAVGGAFGALDATFVVNDDVDAALALGADGVHLGQGDDGAERALEAGLLLGISVANRREAAIAEYLGASYVGAGAIWATLQDISTFTDPTVFRGDRLGDDAVAALPSNAFVPQGGGPPEGHRCPGETLIQLVLPAFLGWFLRNYELGYPAQDASPGSGGLGPLPKSQLRVSISLRRHASEAREPASRSR